MFIFIPEDKGVFCIQRVIDARTKVGSPRQGGKGVGKRHDVEAGIQDRRIDHSLVVSVPLFKVQKEGRLLLGDGAADVSTVIARQVRGARRRKRIARIQVLIVESKRCLAAKPIGPGLGKYLDTSQSRSIVFS